MAVLLMAACKHKDVSPSVAVTGLLNGAAWQQQGWSFRTEAFISQGYASVAGSPCNLKITYIDIQKLNPQKYSREDLVIYKVPPSVGKYPITKVYSCSQNANVGASYYLLGEDGDVLRAVFTVVESADNYLTIERIDSSANRIVGNLQVTFATTPNNKSLDTPYDTFRFTNFHFDLPLTRK